MLNDLINENTVRTNVNAKDWEDAIRIGGNLLKKSGIIGQEYIDAMIQSVKDIGPYIVLAPGIAMPHANPRFGVKGLGMSLITLNTPVYFGNKDNDPVSIVICLSATKNNDHLKELSELVKVLGNDSNVQQIKSATTIKAILDIFSNVN
ncbi:PTS sugar transporter subunit IIA [Pectinatus frisingensis]|uniref:PTS sugar transporter subunit IIA n=1 Tax=Pectinatus frisingensis TaxID=865 RepID=UPI0015F3D926|nr:PTS sugar transporter subunit IIA [Pectinatus frisingensis]